MQIEERRDFPDYHPDVRAFEARDADGTHRGVFLLDMRDFEKMNAVYSRTFGDHRPARTTIQAAALPGAGLRVEIDCIAYVP